MTVVAEKELSGVWHNEGVVYQELFAAPLDDDLTPTLLGTPPPIDWLVGVRVNDRGGREGLGIKLGASFVPHAGTAWVSLSTGSVDHVCQDQMKEEGSLISGRTRGIGERVRWDLCRNCRVDLARGVKAVISPQNAQEVAVRKAPLLLRKKEMMMRMIKRELRC